MVVVTPKLVVSQSGARSLMKVLDSFLASKWISVKLVSLNQSFEIFDQGVTDASRDQSGITPHVVGTFVGCCRGEVGTVRFHPQTEFDPGIALLRHDGGPWRPFQGSCLYR